jgi:hypothetical protein
MCDHHMFENQRIKCSLLLSRVMLKVNVNGISYIWDQTTLWVLLQAVQRATGVVLCTTNLSHTPLVFLSPNLFLLHNHLMFSL